MRVRSRYAELAAAICAAGLLAVTFAPWFEGSSGKLSAWEALGVTDVVVVIVALAALAFALASLTRISVSVPIPGSVITAQTAFVAAVLIALQIASPPDGAGLEVWIWIALALSIGLTAAGWFGMQEELPARRENAGGPAG